MQIFGVKIRVDRFGTKLYVKNQKPTYVRKFTEPFYRFVDSSKGINKF